MESQNVAEPLTQRLIRRFSSLSSSAIATANQTQDLGEAMNELVRENAMLRLQIEGYKKTLDEATKKADSEMNK